MKAIGIIPARGGSKGIPEKNIRKIDGVPLIQFTIEAALDSELLDEVWVSSDSERILSIANQFEGFKLHERNAEHSTDTSPVTQTVAQILSLTSSSFDVVVLLQPTAPIRTGEDIDKAIRLLAQNKQGNTVISVCEMHDIHPARMYWQRDNSLSPILSKYEEVRRQDIPPAYYRNGAIYIVKTSAFKKEHSFMVKPIIPYVMSSDHLLNIDEPRDLIIAEALIKAWKKGLL